jgi:hypothetical protein
VGALRAIDYCVRGIVVKSPLSLTAAIFYGRDQGGL